MPKKSQLNKYSDIGASEYQVITNLVVSTHAQETS